MIYGRLRCEKRKVCVMLRDTFHTVYAKGKGREDYGFSASNFTIQEYRDLVKKALQGKFRTVYCKIELPNVVSPNWRKLQNIRKKLSGTVQRLSGSHQV